MTSPFRLLWSVAALLGCLLALAAGLFGSGSNSFWRAGVGIASPNAVVGSMRYGAAVPHRELISSNSGGGKDARLAFLIMSSGNDAGRLHLLLPEIYHPDNIYLVHVDAKAPAEKV